MELDPEYNTEYSGVEMSERGGWRCYDVVGVVSGGRCGILWGYNQMASFDQMVPFDQMVKKAKKQNDTQKVTH